MKFIASRRIPQIEPRTHEPLDPTVTHLGDTIITERGGVLQVMGTSTDPFAADREADARRTLTEAEIAADRHNRHRKERAS